MRRLVATTLVLCLGVALAAAQSVDALLRKAKDYADRKEYTLALETLGSLLYQDPKNAQALELKSQVLKLSAAAQAAGRAEQIFVEAKTYHELGQASRAQKRLKELLVLDPNHAEGQQLLATIELDGEMELLGAEDQPSGVKEGDFVDLDQVDNAPELLEEAPRSTPRSPAAWASTARCGSSRPSTRRGPSGRSTSCGASTAGTRSTRKPRRPS